MTVGVSSIEVYWSSVATAATYKIKCGTDKAQIMNVVASEVTAPATSTVIPISAQAQQPYYCHVAAVNSGGTGRESDGQVGMFGLGLKGALQGDGAQSVLGTSLCAVGLDYNVYCWGSNTYGDLGNGTNTLSNSPSRVSGSGALAGKTIKQITTGSNTSCAIASDNNAYCWGRNDFGQLGNGNNTHSNVPVAVNTAGVLAGKTIKQIMTTQGLYFCAIASDDKVYCWGRGTNGQFGNGVFGDSNIPVAVNTSGVLSGKTVKQMALNDGFVCVLASDDKVYCWGINNGGNLGNGTTTNSSLPVAVNTSGVLSGKTIKYLDVGSTNVCVIASDNKAYCWGRNTNGELGNGNNTDSSVPVAVNSSGALSGKTVKQLKIGRSSYVCAIASDNKVYCWGKNNYRQLGIGNGVDSNVPVAVNTSGVLAGKSIKDIVAHEFHTCAVSTDGKVYCWGANAYGALGNGLTSGYSDTPSAVTASGVLAGKVVEQLVVSQRYMCAVASDDGIYCWGMGTGGQLGNGASLDSSVPVAVQNLVPY